MFVLIDEGTLDTVLHCPDCDEEQRYTFQPIDWRTEYNEYGGNTESIDDCGRGYDIFVTDMIEFANDGHECSRGYEGKE